jgi:thiol-disulfide isomerase/thioredoxin
MLLKRVGPWIFLFAIVAAVFVFKAWQQRSESTTPSLTDIKGPAVILFRGDNSTNCQAIHKLVDEAETRHGKQVHFAQFDWSDDNPLIKKYGIHFLPTVVFVNKQNKEVGRIVGESPAVQQKLKQALIQVEDLVLQ